MVRILQWFGLGLTELLTMASVNSDKQSPVATMRKLVGSLLVALSICWMNIRKT